MVNGGLSTFLFASRWRETNPCANLAAVESVFECVRLEGVSTADLASIVRPSGLIPIATLRALYDERLKVQEMVRPHALLLFPSRLLAGRLTVPLRRSTRSDCGRLAAGEPLRVAS